ncbi:family 16 glycoside hydrolase [Cryphonectria parasitica EP155]|uniref:Family 16 glycoside hydrolase n=1 Tax=Cryphonectria parasitica (strain ATCC 38755 / EP155) TaxID=660469 RepID=A0A9P5CQN7_CRYP1|nr:family 16 glycoside hydrolase [Cryphonectria parasitica EP155]KAF3767719.1 family 16 glycoside hydrolase [Cryphonectria parasitica EP155]
MSSYSLSTSYVGQSLIDGFNFVSIVDPTGGFVAYQDYNDAVAAGLVSVDDTTQAVTLSVDTTNIYNPDGSQGGRPSVRIESFEAFNEGLLIGDFAHMPGSVCGGWPAFWMYGPNWPNDGEVDIIEGANMAYTNLMSAHTSANCLLPSTGDFSGTQEITDCNNPDGCNYIPPTSDTSSYGDDFNAVGGGVYALEWTSDILRIWHFARGGIPQDIIDQQPNPSNWGTPQALFGTDSCDVSTHFANMSIVLNIDFCGNYGDALWGSGSCSSYAATCEDFVGNNPSALTDLYWEVNYIDFYSMSAGSTTTTLPSISTESSVPVNGSVTRGPSIRRSTTLPSASATTTPETTSSGNGNGVGTPTTTAASSSAPSPVDSIVPRHNPATIGPFTYLGCFTSGTGFSTFDLAGTDPALTLEECTSLCGGSTYAGAIDQ